MQGYAPACRDEAFTGAREQFAETEEWLAGEAAGLQHADLEEQLEVAGPGADAGAAAGAPGAAGRAGGAAR